MNGKKKYADEIVVKGRCIGGPHPTYFIADIAANHDGDLSRAKDLIHLAARSGADAAKFQHFTADTIVSDKGFKALGNQQSHQAKWSKSVFDVYKDATLNSDWTSILSAVCEDAGIHFLTSPYSFDLVDAVDEFIPAYKIGSGDITWLEILEHIARKNKPVFLATGASTFDDVRVAVETIVKHNPQIALMQCNTNYTGSGENFQFVNLRVLNSFRAMYPEMVLGLSDHTPGHATVLGAVALGARVIEKHFTDSRDRAGPDHGFSMEPAGWREMVYRTRELEAALGSGIKKVESNENETVILQRRASRARCAIKAGENLDSTNIEFLRPCPGDALTPAQFAGLKSPVATNDICQGDHLRWNDVKQQS